MCPIFYIEYMIIRSPYTNPTFYLLKGDYRSKGVPDGPQPGAQLCHFGLVVKAAVALAWGSDIRIFKNYRTLFQRVRGPKEWCWGPNTRQIWYLGPRAPLFGSLDSHHYEEHNLLLHLGPPIHGSLTSEANSVV